jgi:asparagine synthase (glutamine-hydrolysing)
VVLRLAGFGDLGWIEMMNGMFTFAIWDETRQSLLLARDRLGVKPLYYADLGSSFIFASEIKPLLMFPGVQRGVNEERIPEYLAFRSIIGEETIFKGIKQVPPGHAVILHPDAYEVKIKRFWHEGLNRSGPASAVTNGTSQAQFTELLKTAVKSRLISEVPLGTYNSGGVDSSLVTAIVRKFNSEELHTFSVGFDEATHDERKYSNIISKMYRTNHHAIVVNREDYAKEIFRTTWHLEEPINHPHTVQILLLSKLAKEFVTVVLTGEGADEVFGGYPRYNIAKVHRLVGPMPNFVQKLIRSVLVPIDGRRVQKIADNISYDGTEVLINNARFVPVKETELIYPQGINLAARRAIYDNRYLRGGDLVQRLLYYDQRTYLPSLLTRLDKMSMAASIEARVPFLDYRLVEWSYKLASSEKIRWFTNKYIVKRAAEGYLPKEIIYRKKFGFDVPVKEWLRSNRALGQFLDLLRAKAFRDRGYFNQKTITKLIDEHLAATKDHSEILWGLLSLEIWHRVFIDAAGSKTVSYGQPQ